jgi:hypothetical protein
MPNFCYLTGFTLKNFKEIEGYFVKKYAFYKMLVEKYNIKI